MNVAPTLVKMKEHVNSGKILTNASAEMVMRARTVKGTSMTVHKIPVKKMESVLTWKMISSASASQVQNQKNFKHQYNDSCPLQDSLGKGVRRTSMSVSPIPVLMGSVRI